MLSRLLLGAVFLMSAVTKLASPGQFARDVESYRILRGASVTVFAWTLPVIELGAALLLVSGFYSTWASLAVVVMLLSFMTAVGTAMARGQSLSCSCFGLLYRERVGWSTQIRDGVLLAIALLVLLRDDGSLTIYHLFGNIGSLKHTIGFILTLLALGFSLVVALLSIRLARREGALR